jgi:two-component system, NtrC family, response regulator HydG
MMLDLPAPGTRILLASPEHPAIMRAAALARDWGADVATAPTPEAALAQLRQSGADLLLLSVEFDVPPLIETLRRERFTLPVIACGVDASADRAVSAIRAGARDYLPLPPDRELIAAAILSVAEGPARLIGQDPALLRALDFGLAMARGAAPVLISGEAGTGRELMGRAIHTASGRRGRLVTVECKGVAPEVLASDLFGHGEDAARGQPGRIGRLEEAAAGTLLLREVTALPQAEQARLAAYLRTGRTARLGSNAVSSPGARIVATSTEDLASAVGEGRFRADLATALGRVRLEMPPLRQRLADIPALAEAFSDTSARANGMPARPFTPKALERLAGWRWPGNVRELEDLVYRAVLLAPGPEIDCNALVLDDGRALVETGKTPTRGPASDFGDSLVGRSVEAVERELILQTLAHCRGNRTTASSILGISVRTMRNKLKTFAEAGIPVVPAA